MSKFEGARHHFSSGVYAREMELKAGFKVNTHSHKYDHMSLLAKGHAVVISGDIKKEYIAPSVIEIKAGIEHEIIAIEDVLWFCIHATSETDINKIDEDLSE